jgi:hypothetical protein
VVVAVLRPAAEVVVTGLAAAAGFCSPAAVIPTVAPRAAAASFRPSSFGLAGRLRAARLCKLYRLCAAV